MGSEAYADYMSAIHDPATVHAMIEDYRAGVSIDRAHDEADRHGRPPGHLPDARRLGLLQDDMEELYGDPLCDLEDWVDAPLSGHGVNCGHPHRRGEAGGASAALLARIGDTGA